MATDGAPVRSDDPALQEAFSEMASEGFDYNAPVDLSEPDASQPADDGAPAVASAQPAPAGDDATPAASVTPTSDSQPAADGGTSTADPLAGSEPYSYGESKTVLEGAYRVPGEGLFVPEDKFAQFDQVITTLERTAREQFDRASTLERMSEWRTTKPDGTEQVISGPDAVQEMRLQLVRQAIQLETLNGLASDPSKYIALLLQNADGTFALDQEKLDGFLARMHLAERDAVDQVRTHLGARRNPAPVQTAPDYAKQHGEATITALAGDKASALSRESRTTLLAQFNRYVSGDGKSVAPEYKALVEHLASSDFARKAEVAAAEKAGKHNAGMDQGRIKAKAVTPAPKPAPAAPSGKPVPVDTYAPFKQAMEELGIPL